MISILQFIVAAQTITVLAQAGAKPRSIDFASDWIGPDGPWAAYVVTVAGIDGFRSTEDFRMCLGFSLPFVMLPIDEDFCNGTHASEGPVCRARNVYELQANPTLYCGSSGLLSNLSFYGLENLAGPNGTRSMQLCGGNNVALTDVDSGNNSAWTNQDLAGISSSDFFYGVFGLSDSTVANKNQTAYTLPGRFELPLADFLPSNSFSYTAGSYQRNRIPPSLVLGGYDASRIQPDTTYQKNVRNNATAPDLPEWQFQVNISSISLSQQDTASHRLSFAGQDVLTAYIDPVTPYIWLPKSVCESFETAFGIEWNEESRLYLVNSSTHDRLLRVNPQVNFTLGPGLSGEGKTFTLPYSAFDLNVTYPFVETESYYFPLKRVVQSGRLVLGRTFLQEVHISVDYGSGYFNLSQATWTPNSESRIVPIARKSEVKSSTEGITGAKIALIVVAILGLTLFCTSTWCCWVPLGLEKRTSPDVHVKPELHGAAQPWIELMPKEWYELEGKQCSAEVMGSQVVHEMDASRTFELGGMGIVKCDA